MAVCMSACCGCNGDVQWERERRASERKRERGGACSPTYTHAWTPWPRTVYCMQNSQALMQKEWESDYERILHVLLLPAWTFSQLRIVKVCQELTRQSRGRVQQHWRTTHTRTNERTNILHRQSEWRPKPDDVSKGPLSVSERHSWNWNMNENSIMSLFSITPQYVVTHLLLYVLLYMYVLIMCQFHDKIKDSGENNAILFCILKNVI